MISFAGCVGIAFMVLFPVAEDCPIRIGGPIGPVHELIQRRVKPGTCLEGSFNSAGTMVLGVRNVRVRSDAKFHFHHAKMDLTAKREHNYWYNIWPEATAAFLKRLNNPKLADHLYSKLPLDGGWYTMTGRQLVAYGYKPC